MGGSASLQDWVSLTASMSHTLLVSFFSSVVHVHGVFIDPLHLLESLITLCRELKIDCN